MTRNKHFLARLAAVTVAAVLTALAPVPLAAQSPGAVYVVPATGVTSLSASVTAVDTAPLMIVKYIGPTVQAHTFAVTTFDYIFTVGGSADATINVQATTPCGGSVGTLDTNDSDCNTLQELVNEINASPNWLAIPISGLPSDSVDTGGRSSAADVGAVVTPAAGTVVYIDSSDALTTYSAFTPGNRVDIRDYVTGTSGAYLPMDPWKGKVTTVDYYLQNFTCTAAGTATDGFWAIKDVWGGTAGKTWSPTVRQIYAFTGAATTVDKALDFSRAPLFGNPGERIVARGVTTVTHTAPRVQSFGFVRTP